MRMYNTMLLLMLSIVIFSSCQFQNNNSEQATTKVSAAMKIDSTTKPLPKMIGLDIDYCMGKFDPTSHDDFISIPLQYANREGMYMRKEAYEAYLDMHAAASTEGIDLQIRSAARNFDYQRGIWERKWTGATTLSDGTNAANDISQPVARALKILEYSSMPGTSRHHWGTDIDLNAFNNEYFETGKGKKIYDWLTIHAKDFGYCQPYTAKNNDRPHGYNEEKWHWSYMAISADITNYAEHNLLNKMISGFDGSETAEEIDVVKHYVLGISHGCRH